MGAGCGKSFATGEPAFGKEVSDPVNANDTLSTTASAASRASEASRSRGGKGIIVTSQVSSMSLRSQESMIARKGSFVRKNLSELLTVYDIEDSTIGQGTFGVVQRGTHRLTGVSRAVKTIPKGPAKSVESHRREIAIMKGLTHPHIVQLFETFEDHKHLYLAMELCTGGELFDKIVAERRFSEGKAATIVQQILGAVYYMHDHHLVHRDLKPENFLLQTQQPIETNSLKLIDFGTATECLPGRHLKSKIGTLLYMAPQVLMARYDSKCDVWSCGVIAYALLCGHHPFGSEGDDQALARKVRAGVWTFKGSAWEHISEDAKEFVHRLLRISAKHRASADEALRHQWVQTKASKAASAELKEDIGTRLLQYKVRNGLEKAALEIAAGQLSDEQIRELRAAFQVLDTNGDGRICLKELCAGLDKAGLAHCSSAIHDLFDSADTDGSGELNYTQFLAATLDRESQLTEDVVWTAFNVFDQNGDGRISKKEAKAVLAQGRIKMSISTNSMQDMLGEEGGEEAGISFDDFRMIMHGKTER